MIVFAAILRLARQHRNVMPRAWVPIWIIIALLGTLETVTVTVRILTGACCADVVVHVTISGVKSAVSLNVAATFVKCAVLMHAELRVQFRSETTCKIGEKG